jgi:EAL domain-containing protein (putative c-di-GMP-specific phosphodiesterase class I)
MMCEPQVAALTRTIVELARILNLQLVAEGIEDPDQLEHLRGLDCKLGQGFYLHRPMDGAAVEQLARAQAGAPSAA